MSEMKQDAATIWKEYEQINEYLLKNNIFAIVKKNEDFYNGRQWGALEGKTDQATPTMNRLQRIGKYQISMLSSNDVGISIKYPLGSREMNQMLNIVSDEVKDVIEQAKIVESARLMIRDGFIDGASYMMQSFEPDYETGQDSKGRIENQIVEMTRVLFGNPYDGEIQKQPFIIIVLRQYLGQVKEEARERGVSEEEIEEIKNDNETNYEDDSDGKLCTVLIKFYRKKIKEKKITVVTDESGNEAMIETEEERKTVFFTKTTRNVVIIPETNLGYTRYPISRFGWDNRKNSFLYDSPMTSNIVNQVFINKCYYYAHQYAVESAFPKTLYDISKLSKKALSSKDIGLANLDLLGKFLDYSKAPDFSNQVIQLITQTENEMERNMGVNDAALGNVKPDNTSAIVALQEAASVPLEIQRQNFYEMWEDTIRNILDIMIASYGQRLLFNKETQEPVMVDFDKLRGLNYRLSIDIGSSAQYSEIAQINTLTNLFESKAINLETFLEVCPDKYIPGKEELKKYAEEMKNAQEQAMVGAQVPTTNL